MSGYGRCGEGFLNIREQRQEGATLQIPADCSVFNQINSRQNEGAVAVLSYLCLPDNLNHFTNRAALIVAILFGINWDLNLEHLSSQISKCLVSVAGTALPPRAQPFFLSSSHKCKKSCQTVTLFQCNAVQNSVINHQALLSSITSDYCTGKEPCGYLSSEELLKTR